MFASTVIARLIIGAALTNMSLLSTYVAHRVMLTELFDVAVHLTLVTPPWVRDVKTNVDSKISNFQGFRQSWRRKGYNKRIGWFKSRIIIFFRIFTLICICFFRFISFSRGRFDSSFDPINFFDILSFDFVLDIFIRHPSDCITCDETLGGVQCLMLFDNY